MPIKSVQVPIPSDGSVVPVQDSAADPLYGDEVSYRNTGTVNVLLGGSDAQFYPLQSGTGGFGEAYSTAIAEGDVMYAKVASAGTAGQISAIKAR